MGKVTKSLNEHRAALNVSKLFFGSLSDTEARQANGWNQDDMEYRAEFLANTHLLSDVDALKDDEELLLLASEPTKSRRFSGMRLRLSMVASFLLVAAVSLTLYMQGNPLNDSVALRYVTRVGEVKSVNLSDGSVITLNTGTQIMVNITKDERRVILERGEAYFDVARDEGRPFNVAAGSHKVTVLGTEFSVHRQPEQLQVVVSEGVVCVHPTEELASAAAPLLGGALPEMLSVEDSGQFRMEAGWIAELNTNKHQVSGYRPENVELLSSWRSGYLEFSRLPLYKVVQELNRYNGKKILIEDPEIIELKVSALVRIDRINQALRDLESTSPINVVSHFDRIVLTGEH